MSPCLFEIPAEERLEAGTLKWTSDKIFHFGEANNPSKKGVEIGEKGKTARTDRTSFIFYLSNNFEDGGMFGLTN